MEVPSSGKRPHVRERLVGLLAATLLAAGLITVGVLVTGDAGSLGVALGVGVVGSLIASLYALALNEWVLGDVGRQSEVEASTELSQEPAPVAEGSDYRVHAIKPKVAYSRKEWTAILEEAQTELFIVGHALNKWCRDDMQGPFAAAIRRLALDGRTVLLIVLPPDGEITRRLTEQRGQDYERRVVKTLEVLACIRRDLPERCRTHLDVRMLKDGTPMPYMLAGNDRVLVTAPYPVAALDSDPMLAATVDADTPFGSAIREDLRALAKTYSEPVNLERY